MICYIRQSENTNNHGSPLRFICGADAQKSHFQTFCVIS